MARAKYQVLVIPYIIQDEMIKYAVFNRSDMQVWQFIAGVYPKFINVAPM